MAYTPALCKCSGLCLNMQHCSDDLVHVLGKSFPLQLFTTHECHCSELIPVLNNIKDEKGKSSVGLSVSLLAH